MKVKLMFGRTCYDELTAWADMQEVEVDIPDWLLKKSNDWHSPQYHLLGMVAPSEESEAKHD